MNDIYSQETEEREYQEFMAKLIKKATEANKDFNTLSQRNQARVRKEAMSFLRTSGILAWLAV